MEMPTLLVIRYRNPTQAGVSFEGYLLAQLTKETKIRLVFRFGWIQGLRCCHQASFSLFLSSCPFFSVDFVLKEALSHMAVGIPAAPASVLIAQ